MKGVKLENQNYDGLIDKQKNQLVILISILLILKEEGVR